MDREVDDDERAAPSVLTRADTLPAVPLPVKAGQTRPAPDVEARLELEELLEGVRFGDDVAFAGLYARTVSRVYAVVNRVIQNHALSEDTVQNVYLQIWSTAHTYNPGLGSPNTWIVTIAHRRAVDMVRAEQYHKERNIKYGRQVERAEDPVPALIDRLAAGQSLDRYWHTLTDLQRQAIDLAYFGGLTGPEIAAELGVKVSTVKTRIRDGIQRLRADLADGHPHHTRQSPEPVDVTLQEDYGVTEAASCPPAPAGRHIASARRSGRLNTEVTA